MNHGFERLAVMLLSVLTWPSDAVAEPVGDAPQPRHVREIQLGAGPTLWVTDSGDPVVGPTAHVHARVAAWRAIGLGLYTGGTWLMHDQPGVPRTVVPVCARLNLTMPFWASFEPALSVGYGMYFYSGVRSRSESAFVEPGGHVALALLFPRARFGFESSAHLTRYRHHGWGIGGMMTGALTMLFRAPL